VSMWKRREEEVTPKPTGAAPNPVEVKKEATPLSSMSNTPFKSPEPDRGQATIGKAVKIVGQIFSKEDLYVDGDLEGTIEALEHKISIGPNGKVQAGVKAREVVILGNLQGNVEAADKIEIRKDAKLVGDIKTARIVIEDGAFFKGSIDIVRHEPKPAQAPQRQQAAPASASAAANAPATVR
jgi:cytoskeletal protein CcmA (bactofilin family)